MSPRRADTGRLGEQTAADYLTQLGYRIVDANWRTRFGELDLVAWHGTTLVFVEVRTRASAGLGTAGESVGTAKQRQLVLMAQQYMQQRAPNASARIDVVTVYIRPGRAPELEHLIGAISAD